MTSREEAHKRRAEAREMRRAKLSTSRGDDEEGKQRKGSGENRNAENSTTENSPGRTAAKVAVIGASVGAVTLAGKKLLSFRGPRRKKGGETGETAETS